MRFHVGRKIGKTFVGASTGGRRNRGNGVDAGTILAVVFLPIIIGLAALYFGLVWPMRKLYKSEMEKPVKYILMSLLCVAWGILALAGCGRGSEETQEVSISAPTPTPAAVAAAVTPLPAKEPTKAAPAATAAPTPEPAADYKAAYVDADELNLRDAPSTDGELIGTYTNGQPLKILGESGDWYKVEADGKEGYMLAEYVSLGDASAQQEEPQETPQETPKQTYSRAIYRTKTGKRYHYDSTCNGGTYYICTMEEASKAGLTACDKCVN